VAKILHGRSHVGGLIDVGLAERSGPVNLVGHHPNDGWIVTDGLYANVPILIVDAVLAVGADVTGGLFDLIGEGRGDKDLGKKWVGVKSDGREKIVELIGRKVFVGTCLLVVLILRLRRLVLPEWGCGNRGGVKDGNSGETTREKDRQKSGHEQNVSFDPSLLRFPTRGVSRIAQRSGPIRDTGAWAESIVTARVAMWRRKTAGIPARSFFG